jgi:tetratricopeptide (TPR) repeat protein
MRHYEEAVSDMSQAIRHRQEPHYYFMRGRYNLYLKRYHDACTDFSEVLRLGDAYRSTYYRVSALFCRAEALLHADRLDDALRDCSLVPDGTQIWIRRMRSKEDIVEEIMHRKSNLAEYEAEQRERGRQ